MKIHVLLRNIEKLQALSEKPCANPSDGHFQCQAYQSCMAKAALVVLQIKSDEALKMMNGIDE